LWNWPQFEFCGSDDPDSNLFLVAFTDRRTVEMAEYTCRVHGGRLPVPENALQNKASTKNSG
jgi:hypothetical protein